jgi:flagellin-like protein
MFERLRSNKKGVSEIIASLLLILIITSAGVVVYAYSINAFGSSSSHFQQQTHMDEEQTLERLQIIRVWWDNLNQFNLTVLNCGEINWVINAIYINGIAVNGIQVTDSSGVSVDFTGLGQLALVKFISPITITSGSVYEIIVVTERGGRTSVNWKA